MSAGLSAAMLKAYKEGLGVDFGLVCQGEVKMVHSQVRIGQGCIGVGRCADIDLNDVTMKF